MQYLMTKLGSRLRRAWACACRLCCVAARDERGSAGVELAIGAIVVVTIALIAADFYILTKVGVAGGRIAATMADYVSRERAPNGDEMLNLGQYLHDQELNAPTHLVFVVSAVQQPAGTGAARSLWVDDTIRFGDADETSALAVECTNRGNDGWRKALLGLGSTAATETLPLDTVVIVVEVCVKPSQLGMLTSEFVTGMIYRLHVLPVRDKNQRAPATPVHSPPDSAAVTSPDGEPIGSSAHAASGHTRFPVTAGVA